MSCAPLKKPGETWNFRLRLLNYDNGEAVDLTGATVTASLETSPVELTASSETSGVELFAPEERDDGVRIYLTFTPEQTEAVELDGVTRIDGHIDIVLASGRTRFFTFAFVASPY